MAKKVTYAACGLLVTVLVSFGVATAGEMAGRPPEDLGGVTIQSSQFPLGAVTLRNGEYRQPAAPGSATDTIVKLSDKRAFGTLNGREAAVIIISTDAGGSGTFFDLALLIREQKGWVNVDTVPLGDRVNVHDVSIKEDEVFVNLTTHGPVDALCCPTQEKIMRFRVKSDRVVMQDDEKKNGIGEQEIIGKTWQWVRMRDNNDTTVTRPADAAGYILQMKQDGTIQIRGDCNLGGGSFTVQGSKLTIAITYSTMAACPEGSLENLFIRDLSRTGGYRLKNGVLYLDLQYNSGTMEFREVRRSTQ